MEIHVFARFHVLEGKEGEATLALREVLGPSRKEPGCVSIHAFRSIRDGRLFYIHSKWKDQEAFEVHICHIRCSFWRLWRPLLIMRSM